MASRISKVGSYRYSCTRRIQERDTIHLKTLLVTLMVRELLFLTTLLIYSQEVASQHVKWSVAIPDSVKVCGSRMAGDVCQSIAAPQCDCGVYGVAVSDDGSTVYFGTTFQGIYALNVSSGKQLFHSPVSMPVNVDLNIIARNGSVFVPSGEQAAAELTALDAATGIQQWKFFRNKSRVSGSITLSNSMVYIPVYGGYGFSHLFALDSSTGNVSWCYTTKRFDLIHNTASTASSLLLLLSVEDGTNALMSLNAQTGGINWKTMANNNHQCDSSIALSHDQTTAFFACNGASVYAIGVSSGAVKWNFTRQGDLEEALVRGVAAAADGSSIFVSTAGGPISAVHSVQLFALDFATGQFKWSRQVPACNFGTSSGLGTSIGDLVVSADSKTVYLACNGEGSNHSSLPLSSHLLALDAASGQELWNVTQANAALASTSLALLSASASASASTSTAGVSPGAHTTTTTNTPSTNTIAADGDDDGDDDTTTNGNTNANTNTNTNAIDTIFYGISNTPLESRTQQAGVLLALQLQVQVPTRVPQEQEKSP